MTATLPLLGHRRIGARRCLHATLCLLKMGENPYFSPLKRIMKPEDMREEYFILLWISQLTTLAGS